MLTIVSVVPLRCPCQIRRLHRFCPRRVVRTWYVGSRPRAQRAGVSFCALRTACVQRRGAHTRARAPRVVEQNWTNHGARTTAPCKARHTSDALTATACSSVASSAALRPSRSRSAAPRRRLQPPPRQPSARARHQRQYQRQHQRQRQRQRQRHRRQCRRRRLRSRPWRRSLWTHTLAHLAQVKGCRSCSAHARC